jgi:L,D-peptidoglycan transpeptidase YkuD (ErfK/YbiS/YcfS/YnhG family)
VIGFIAALLSPFLPGLSTLLITCVKPLAWWIASVADWTYNVLVDALFRRSTIPDEDMEP